MKQRLRDHFDINEMNTTEIVQLCQQNGLPGAARFIPRKILLEHLMRLEPIDIASPIDAMRRKLSLWLRRNWGVMEMQVDKPQCPRCDDSCDLQVVWCFLDNHTKIT